MKSKYSKEEFAERCMILADTFLGIHELWGDECKVDMLEGDFDLCGTVACHAGWFAVAQGKSSGGWCSYLGAANDMAVFLGFERHLHLMKWADLYPGLWGNPYGRNMFADPSAFEVDLIDITLKTIGDHWHGVARRVMGISKGE